MNARCPRSLSLTLAFVSSLALAGRPATAAEPHYYGNWQTEPCKTWSIAHDGRDPARERAAEWLAGYLSANSVYHASWSVGENSTVGELINSLDRFCEQYPGAPVNLSDLVRALWDAPVEVNRHAFECQRRRE
jgi:hypothetical protein